MKLSGKTSGEIFEQVRSLVQSGELKPGQTLPSVRDLAVSLEVNRNTVATAYKRLTDAGFAVSKGRNGTVIRGFVMPAVAMEGTSPDMALRDLAGGNPCTGFLPELSLAGTRAGLYGERSVSAELEAIGRNWMEPDISQAFELNLTSGAVDAVERLLNCYLISGDRVAVEDPCFLSSISTLMHNRLQAACVTVDEEGMQPERLAEQLESGVKALIITPRAHNPTGFGLSQRRAEHIRTLLSDYSQVLIIVDDHFSLLSTETYHHIIPETSRHWALIRSTSKFLGPDLRLAFVASDGETSIRLQQRLNSGTNWVSHIIQKVAASAMTSPGFDSHLSRVRETYRLRRQVLTDLLRYHDFQVSDRHDGLNVWVPLVSDSSRLVMHLALKGWLVRGGEVFVLSRPVHGVRITVSDLDAAEAGKFALALTGAMSAASQ
ncbi:transcriptional regulator PtsJ [Pantoea agglomerans]|uniref:MocR-like B6 salvage transcription factor PtsJ n=1 Tax=Enterobacter agglomerans TaxID=549 RepID=UPI0013C14F55|nr:transcriptional regulator PtsJ [Pantoea agglomerans]NEH20512.1 transcriptional regulator PtsJ [Pantoea agglomerans]